jgi:hypothetical protein
MIDEDGGALYVSLAGASTSPADAKPIPLEDVIALRGGKTTSVLKELAAKVTIVVTNMVISFVC